MARPLKKGLDYFPLSCDFFDEIKLQNLKRHFGANGQLFFIFCLCRIFKNEGYYIKCDRNFYDDIFYNQFIPEDETVDIIAYLVDEGFFDRNLYENYAILSSVEIQKNYIFSTQKRKVSAEDRFNKDFDLINKKDKSINISCLNIKNKFIKTDKINNDKRADKDMQKSDKNNKNFENIMHEYEYEQYIGRTFEEDEDGDYQKTQIKAEDFKTKVKKVKPEDWHIINENEVVSPS